MAYSSGNWNKSFVNTNSSLDLALIQEFPNGPNGSFNWSSVQEKNPGQKQFEYVSMALIRYVLPVIILVGTFGNILSMAVILRKRMLGKSVYFYLLLLACADTAVLYFSALKTWVRAAFGYEFLHVSSASCKSLMFFFVISLHMSAWLVVFLTSDRFVAVWFPLKAAIFCTTRRAAVITTVCFIIVIGYNVHLFWTFHLQTFESGSGTYHKCGPYSNDNFHKYTYNYLKFATYSIIPFAAVLFFNVGIVIKLNKDSPMLRNSKSFTTSKQGGNSGGRHVDGRNVQNETQRRITYMLLAVSFSWLILTVPFTLFSVLPGSWYEHETYGKAPGLLAKVICFILMYINHSTNFFLYCLTGRKFRQEVADILCLIPNQKRGQSNTHYSRTTRTPVLDHVWQSSNTNDIQMREV